MPRRAFTILALVLPLAGAGLISFGRPESPPDPVAQKAEKPRAAIATTVDRSAPLPGALSPRNANYSIDVRLDHPSRTLTGREVITWRNISANAAPDLRFHLYYNAWKNAQSTWMREARLGRRASARAPQPDDWGWINVTGEGLEPIPGGPADQNVDGMFNVDTALGDSTHATLDILSKSIKDLQGHSGLNSIFGVRGMIPNIPGTDAADAQAKLNTIKTQLSLKAIADMRASSKTGGAVGQVTEKEWPRLESAFASLEQAQSVESAKQAMDEIQTIIRESKERVDKSFNMKYGDKVQGGGAGGMDKLPSAVQNKGRTVRDKQTGKLLRSDGCAHAAPHEVGYDNGVRFSQFRFSRPQCQRLIWLDKGRIVLDGDSLTVANAYRKSGGNYD